MRKYFIALVFLVFLIIPDNVFAQIPSSQFSPEMPQENVYVARVKRILNEGSETFGGSKNPYQTVEVEIVSKDKKGEIITIEHGKLFTVRDDLLVKKGEKVVLLSFPTPQGGEEYTIVEKYRLDRIIAIVAAFLFLIVGLSRFKGLGSILGLGISLLVIIQFIVPGILKGQDPLLITLLGCGVIMSTTIFMAHGLSKQTVVAVLSTFIVFIITGVLSLFFTAMAKLSGLGTDEAYSLQYGLGDLNFRGLLLSGMIIGTLGVLDDITTSLSASIFELAKTNRYSKTRDLFTAGFRIGKEHISSLVNTLVLAYAGTSLPLMLFIVINPSEKPMWAILNSELLSEEIIRSMVGSFSLVFAVPITTLIAAYVSLRFGKKHK